MLTRLELSENFAELLERERESMNLTLEQMANKVGMSLISYKNLINGKTSRVDLYNAYILFQYDERAILQLFEYPEDLLDIAGSLSKLSPMKIAIIKLIIGAQKPEEDEQDKTPVKTKRKYTKRAAKWFK